MVDVGYNIDGRRGVIRNVVPLSNTATEHLCFVEAKGDEQYALKKENIDYVVPHEATCEDIKDEGKFDYNISFSVKEWYDECRDSCRVHKSELADTLEHIFEWGAYNVKVSCIERERERGKINDSK